MKGNNKAKGWSHQCTFHSSCDSKGHWNERRSWKCGKISNSFARRMSHIYPGHKLNVVPIKAARSLSLTNEPDPWSQPVYSAKNSVVCGASSFKWVPVFPLLFSRCFAWRRWWFSEQPVIHERRTERGSTIITIFISWKWTSAGQLNRERFDGKWTANYPFRVLLRQLTVWRDEFRLRVMGHFVWGCSVKWRRRVLLEE